MNRIVVMLYFVYLTVAGTMAFNYIVPIIKAHRGLLP